MMTTDDLWNSPKPRNFMGSQLKWINYKKNNEKALKAEQNGKPLSKLELFMTVDDQPAHISEQAII